jgi:hypothetical protein
LFLQHQDPLVREVAGFRPVVSSKTSQPQKVMGLDDFSMYPGQKPASLMKPKPALLKPTPVVQLAPSPQPQRPKQQKKPQSQAQSQQNGMSEQPQPSAHDLAAATAASAMSGQNYLPSPHANYQFVMACSTCYRKVGDGYDGFMYKSIRHSCTMEYLLIRPTETLGNSWLKIRPRPPAVSLHTDL